MTKKFAKQSSLILDYGKNGKTLKKLPDGGELKKKKPSERKPIITNDPKDPRLKAYNDSLTLYNTKNFNQLSENQNTSNKTKFINFIPYDKLPKSAVSVSNSNSFEIGNTSLSTKDKVKIKKNGEVILENDDFGEWIYDKDKFSSKVNPNIKPIGFNTYRQIYQNGSKADTYSLSYKKPVQPVVYQKPQDNWRVSEDEYNKKGKPVNEIDFKNVKIINGRKVYGTRLTDKPTDKEFGEPETEEQIERIEGYDIIPTENKKVTPKPTQEKTDFYIQSLDKDGKQKVKYFNSKKEKDDYDEKLSKDFYFTSKKDNSSVYTAVLPEMENGGTMDKLGVENSLWNNIRAKAGSGKKPTKEMLKQEKKIKRKAPDGITLDGESPFVGNLKKMYENAVQGQQQQVQQIGAKVGQQVADTLMPITPVNNVQKNKPNQNQYNDFNAYQQDLTDWEKENNQRSDYKGDTVEKDGIAVVQMTDKELKNPSKQQWGNHLAKPTPPKNERKRGNYAPYFLGGLAAADLLLPNANKERNDNYYNRPEDERYYNPYPNGLNSGALAKNGKTLKQYPDGGNVKTKFLEPNDSKLKKGYVAPFNQPSTELAMSIGGENGEPAYLIPSFKNGKLLKNPIQEFEETGENLGGPFKTWQEAEEFGKMRHKYVEKGETIPFPLKRVGKDYDQAKMKMGGSINNGDDLQLLSDDTDIEQISPSFHKFKDGKHGVKNNDGTEGVPIAFNGQTVEAQAPETFAVKSDGSGVIFSDKTINPLSGKSFKFHTEELAKFENKHVLKPLKKVETLADNIDEQDPFDKLKANTVIAKQMGIKKAQQFVQMKTDELGQIQQNILDISEQTGMKPNEVSKQMKTAKYGMTIPKAPDGETLTKNGTTYKKRSRFSEGVNEIDLERVDGKTRRFGKKDIEKQVKQGKDDGSKKVGFEKDKYSVKMLQEGVSPEQLAKKGLIHKDEIPKAKQYYKPKSEYEYIEQDRGELIPIESNVKPGGIVPKGNVQPVGGLTPIPPPKIPPTKIPGMSFDTEEQITPIEYGKVRNGNWKNYVGPAFGVLDRVNNRSDPGINPRLKDVGEFQNRKLAQINSQGRAFQQGATSTGASVAELATGMGGFAEQAANSEAEIQAFNQGNKNMVYNENIGIVNDFAKFNSEINTINNKRRLMAEGNTKTRNIEALNTIGKYSAMEDRDRNDFVVNQGYYPTYGHDKNTLQPNVRPNQNPFDNDAMFQVGDGRYSRNTPSSTQVRTKDGNTTTTNTYTPQKSITPPKPKKGKKGKYGMSLVKEFKRYKP